MQEDCFALEEAKKQLYSNTVVCRENGKPDWRYRWNERSVATSRSQNGRKRGGPRGTWSILKLSVKVAVESS